SRHRSRWRRARPRRPATEMRDAVSFRSLPLPRNRDQYAQFSFRRRSRHRGTLRYELIDEQERHPCLEIIKQLLKRRLLDLAADRDADKTILGLCSLQVHLRIQYVAAEPRNRAGNPLQQVGAADRYRCAFKQRRAGGSPITVFASA